MLLWTIRPTETWSAGSILAGLLLLVALLLAITVALRRSRR